MTRAKAIRCLDGTTRKCERLLTDDGWGYLASHGSAGTVLVCIPDSRIEGNTEQPREVPPRAPAFNDLLGPVIYSYSRADALADGHLVDVTSTARESGFTVHTAMTNSSWVDCVAWDDETENRKPSASGQDQAGRLWDVLQMARSAIKKASATDRATFHILRVPQAGRSLRPQTVALEIVIGPGDAGEPVITIQQPGED